MSWSPNFDVSLEDLDGIKSNFEQYAQQDDYGIRTLRPKNATLEVDEDVYDQQTDMSMLSIDARAELELKAYRKKLGNPSKKNGTRKWQGQEDDADGVESEISNVLRQSGIEREPSATYRPNSKTTYKSAIPINKIPVAGVKDLYLSEDHFKFENPYTVNPKRSIPEKGRRENGIEETNLECATSSSGSSGDRQCFKTYKEPTVGVAGEKYVSPAQLYAIKARRNR